MGRPTLWCKPDLGPSADAQHTRSTESTICTVGLQLDLGPRLALRVSQKLEQNMGSSPRRSAQKHGVLQSKDVRCAGN